MKRIKQRFHLISPWFFLVASIIFLFIAVYGLRQNNFTMIRLREAVVVADQQNGDVEKALGDLRGFVYAHMNTNLSSGKFAIKPPIQLSNRYNKLVEQRGSLTKSANEAVQRQAEVVCGAKFPAGGFNSPRVACVQDYVAANAIKLNEVPPELYKFDFLSPRWSPDLAGFSLLTSLLFFVLFVVRFSVERWHKKHL